MDILTGCLDSLRKATYEPLEIIVVDNGSADDSVAVVKEQYPEIRLLELPENLGFAGGCNHGVECSTGTYVLILNNDTTHEPGWIEPLVRMLESDKQISAVQPKILNSHHRDTFDYAGASGGYMDMFCFPFTRGRIFDELEKDTGQYDDSVEVFWASGTAFLTRRSLFLETDGFDKDLFAHMEEIDYHWKCRLMGYRVMVEPSSVIFHLGGATLAYASPHKTYLNHRNSMLLLLTNYEAMNAIFLGIPRLFMEIISIIRDAFTGRMDHSGAQIKAFWWLCTHFEVIQQRRDQIKKLRKISDTELMKNLYRRSLVFDYFILDARTFTHLIFLTAK
mgnify:CR=1 FL=1